MHRSGTSAVTGALGALGFQVPKDLMEASESNPQHWESWSLSVFDEDILEHFSGSWEAPPELPGGYQHGLDLAESGDPIELLAAAYPEAGPRVWKDPRVCLLLPYWRALLTGPIAAVLVWRSPVAVARSLRQRDQIPLADGLSLWEHYNREALKGLEGVDTFVVNYESIMEDPSAFVDRITAWLGSLDQFEDEAARWDADKATASIDQGLRHQAGGLGGDDPEPVAETGTLVQFLTDSSGEQRPLGSGPPGDESPLTATVIRLRRAVFQTKRELAVRTRQYDYAYGDLNTALSKLRAKEADLAAALKQLEETAGRLTTTEGHLAATVEHLTNTQRSLLDTQEQLATTRGLLDDEHERLESADKIIERMRGSTSWRLTKPVRSVMSTLHAPDKGSSDS
jgi:hypothetical protein